MADFIAVIRRAVDGLSNNTPEMRARVYEKARAAVVRQLENMSPRPPEHMLQRQLDKLDAAILEVEAEHAEALAPLDDAPPVAMPTAVAATTVAAAAAAPAWAEPAPEPEAPVEAPPQEEVQAAELEPVEAAPAVTGDDWADAHMSEPATSATSAPEAEAADSYHEEPASEDQYAAEQVDQVDAAPQDDLEPIVPAASEETSWRTEPTFGHDAPEADFARIYETRTEPEMAEPPQVEPEIVEEPTPQSADAFEPGVEHATFSNAPTAEENWSRAEEPEPAQPAWDIAPAVEVAPMVFEPEAVEEPKVEAHLEPEAPALGIRVDSVEDWLQSRALDPAPSSPQASWDMPVATETAANRVPELPEIEPGPTAISYTPTDEFPAYEEPVHVEASRDYVAPQGLELPPADPVVLGTLAATPAAASVDADDFSQWFQEHADGNPPRDAEAGSATGASIPSTEWDDHINSFAPSAKGAQVDLGNQADGMEALVGGYGQQPAYRLQPKKRRNFAPLIVGALVLVVLAGGGYLAWSMRDDIGSMVANLTGEIPPAEEATAPPAATPADPQPSTEAPAAETAAAPAAANGEAEQKFTQRLRADGTEIDEGAGSAPITGAPAEGRSVSAQTVASTVEPTDAPPAASGTATTQTPGTAANTAPVAGGEKLFLYEERIGQATPVAVPGSISWTAVRENGADGRPDPQIQGRINVPERGISALLTIKRNTDNSLPASHIIEVVFSVPADFEGGAIENLQRIAMKRTEQDRGDPLVAVTAKVTDDTYLVALNDFEDVVKRNMELLSTRGWIDIPVTYRNGRRALITLDKGTTGGNVFEQVLREWAALTPAAPAN
jgi:hypothetical protein